MKSVTAQLAQSAGTVSNAGPEVSRERVSMGVDDLEGTGQCLLLQCSKSAVSTLNDCSVPPAPRTHVS